MGNFEEKRRRMGEELFGLEGNFSRRSIFISQYNAVVIHNHYVSTGKIVEYVFKIIRQPCIRIDFLFRFVDSLDFTHVVYLFHREVYRDG